jgi:tetratricopeptide (TPR) repeat protein
LVTVNQLAGVLIAVIVANLGATATAQTQTGANSACGNLYAQGQYGPYDFRTNKKEIQVVLRAHFLPIVESLIRGSTNTTPGGDIDYTLRAIPNHPNALISMMRLGEREKTPKPSGSRYTVECWFDRAIRFRPDDQVVRMLYVTYLTKAGDRKPDAMRQLQIVLRAAQDNPFTYFNVGLLYADLNEYDLALVQAHKAMELGLDRVELRDKLKAAGKWRELAAGGGQGTLPEPSAAAAQKP